MRGSNSVRVVTACESLHPFEKINEIKVSVSSALKSRPHDGVDDIFPEPMNSSNVIPATVDDELERVGASASLEFLLRDHLLGMANGLDKVRCDTTFDDEPHDRQRMAPQAQGIF